MLANTSGFVYYVSITGITGAAAPDADKVAHRGRAHQAPHPLPVAVGFGVRTARAGARDRGRRRGVVVGSALVSAIKDSLDRNGKATARTVKAVTALVSELAGGVRGGQAQGAIISAVCRA